MITKSIKSAIIASFVAIMLYFASLSSIEARNMAFPDGIRLNNPGNLIRTDDHWQGMTNLQPKNSRYVRFHTPHDGIRALVKTLITYKDRYGLDTVASIIYRYAPPSENNTHAYINDVARRSGFLPNEVLDMAEPFVLIRLAQAITIHENGIAPRDLPPYWYEDVIYHRAVMDALEDT